MSADDWITPRLLLDQIIDSDALRDETSEFIDQILTDAADTGEEMAFLAVLRGVIEKELMAKQGQAVGRARADGMTWSEVTAYLDVAEMTARRLYEQYGADGPSTESAMQADPGRQWVLVKDAVRQGRADQSALNSITRLATNKGADEYVGKRSGYRVKKYKRRWYVELPIVSDDE